MDYFKPTSKVYTGVCHMGADGVGIKGMVLKTVTVMRMAMILNNPPKD